VDAPKRPKRPQTRANALINTVSTTRGPGIFPISLRAVSPSILAALHWFPVRDTRKILFTALEGCLLDADSGSWSAAQEAIDELERRSVPWVLFSGLTRAQLDPIRRKLGHAGPFVTEHGGGLFVPQGYFPVRIEGQERSGNYQMLTLGKRCGETAAALQELAEECGVSVASLSQMSLHETEQNTGLPRREAEQFRLRDFEERFFFAGASDKAIACFVKLARTRGFYATPGQPFWSFSSVADTGEAARRLAKLFRASAPKQRQSQILAIGTGPEDFAMLSAADRGILLPPENADDDFEPPPRAPRFERAKFPGANGWAEAVLGVLVSR
jgi:mannosyl-3-phosphoglycerate phosphatase family protein